MANPVFIADTAKLKAQLRLSGATQADAVAMIESGIMQGRIYLFRMLGAARVVVIQGYAYNENATTDNEITRLKANNAELAIVKLNLLRSMPVLFMDTSGQKREMYNDEGLTRRANMRDLQEEINRLQLDIDTWLSEIATDDGVVSGDIQISVVTVPLPCDSPIQVSRSIQAGYQHEQDRFGSIGHGNVLGGCL